DLLLDAATRFAERARQSGVLNGLFGNAKGGEGRGQSGGGPGKNGGGQGNNGESPGMNGEGRAPAFILATIHRAENTEEVAALREIIEALNTLHEQIPVVFPMHPRTHKVLDQAGIVPHFVISPPLGYLDMLSLVQSCRSVITDSGGLSREAFFFRKPALVVMQNPFWPELFSHGRCLQAAALKSDILEKQGQLDRLSGAWTIDIFGDGHAAARISDILVKGPVSGREAGHA
ncbi:MAG: UDP-N-acetylglucosamine 2-epimerase, partial [Bacteroidota bacterium]|nr:UDP-N-acetylglucosamine 2-epimerase [Bacteroidota bacterium]